MNTMKSGLVGRPDCNGRTSTDEVGKFQETFTSRLSMIQLLKMSAICRIIYFIEVLL